MRFLVIAAGLTLPWHPAAESEAQERDSTDHQERAVHGGEPREDYHQGWSDREGDWDWDWTWEEENEGRLENPKSDWIDPEGDSDTRLDAVKKTSKPPRPKVSSSLPLCPPGADLFTCLKRPWKQVPMMAVPLTVVDGALRWTARLLDPLLRGRPKQRPPKP